MAWNSGLTKEDERVSSYVKYGREHSQWKGGKTVQSDGYLYLHRELIDVEYHPMLEKSGYVLEHRYVMAKHLGRPLSSNEIVHHIDEDVTNNHIDNLELTDRATHMRDIHPELIAKAQEVSHSRRIAERKILNVFGYVTSTQAAEILGVPFSTVSRRQARGLLSSLPTEYNGRVIPKYELTEHAHLWRRSPKKKEAV